MKKALFALSFGTFGLGVAEFSMMAILPYVAADMGVSIPTAGNFISAYAFGVCVGAPALVILRNRPLKWLLLLLASVMVVGNLCASLSPSYTTFLLSRFVAGLPHGAYFGVASIVAMKVAAEGKGASAVAAMVAGMTVANLAGVPLATFISHMLSWRMVFCFVTLWSLIVFVFIHRLVPDVGSLPHSTFRSQFLFLKHGAPWLILATTMMGNGGVFAWYSYVNPMLTDVSGFSDATVSPLMVLAGLGMVVGNAVGGLLSDRFSAGRVICAVQCLIILSLLGLFALAHVPFVAVALMMCATFGLFAVSSPQQTLIVRHAPGGELLGGACIQIAFNLGNALGAQVGGLPLRHGYGYTSPALVGAAVTAIGLLFVLTFIHRYEPARTPNPPTALR